MGYSSFQGLFRDKLAKSFVVNPCINAGLGGLGADPDPEGCGPRPGPYQPVSSEERDAILDRLNKFTRNWMGQKPHGINWHENHPDIKNALEEVIQAMIRLTQRPKLLRCSAEARKRAESWCDAVDSLLRRVKSDPQHYGGFTSVPTTFVWTAYHLPKFTIRSSSDPAINAAMHGAPAPPPIVTPKEPAPAPEFVGVPTPPEEPPRAPGEAVPSIKLPPELEGYWESLTTGEVFGFPKEYITYGVLALLAYNFLLKGKRR